MAQYERFSTAATETTDRPDAGAAGFPANGLAAVSGVAQSVMRGNMELLSLASRRARAQLELSSQAMACKTPADFGQLGAAFWRDAFQDCLHFNQRLTGLWVESMAAAGQPELARTTIGFANQAMQPLATAAEEAGAAIAEHPTEPWAWWRTDMKGLKPTRNGHSHDESAARVGH